jgi:hypothetical protein
MTLLTRILKDLKDKEKINESKHPHASLLRLINQNIVDAETQVIYPLKQIIEMINNPAISEKNKKQIEKLLSQYKNYFDRSNGGTSTVKRGFKMQEELEKLIK